LTDPETRVLHRATVKISWSQISPFWYNRRVYDGYTDKLLYDCWNKDSP